MINNCLHLQDICSPGDTEYFFPLHSIYQLNLNHFLRLKKSGKLLYTELMQCINLLLLINIKIILHKNDQNC